MLFSFVCLYGLVTGLGGKMRGGDTLGHSLAGYFPFFSVGFCHVVAGLFGRDGHHGWATMGNHGQRKGELTWCGVDRVDAC